jgi:hypothetical protein
MSIFLDRNLEIKPDLSFSGGVGCGYAETRMFELSFGD